MKPTSLLLLLLATSSSPAAAAALSSSPNRFAQWFFQGFTQSSSVAALHEKHVQSDTVQHMIKGS